MYGHGGHLGHVTYAVYINFWDAPHKRGAEWRSG